MSPPYGLYKDAFQIPPPRGSALAPLYRTATMTDTFAVQLPRDSSPDARGAAHAMFEHPPLITRALLLIRDTMVSFIGLKTSSSIHDSLLQTRADCVGFFPVISDTPGEIVMGAKDAHLDFQLAVQTLRVSAETGQDERWIAATTVVHCHNLLGRIYLAGIMPFHRYLMKVNLRGALEALEKGR